MKMLEHPFALLQAAWASNPELLVVFLYTLLRGSLHCFSGLSNTPRTSNKFSIIMGESK